MRTRTAIPLSDGGFTLLELLVVVGVVSVLMGLGIGFLRQSGGGLGEARSALTAQLRTASNTARARGLPTEVRLEPGRDGGRARVTARVLDPVLAVTFEPGARTLNPGLDPRVLGVDEPRGRFGHARRSAPERREPVLGVDLRFPNGDLRQGFAVRLELLLEHRSAAVVARLGTNLRLELDAAGVPKATMVQRGNDGRSGAAVLLQATAPLPLHRWATLELVHDGTSLWLAHDGVELARAPAGDPIHQQGDERLEFSPGDAPVPGAIDEVTLLAYVSGQPLTLPLEVEVEDPVRIAFGPDGEPTAAPAIALRLVREERTETLRVGAGGVLQ